jgi:hypothetical protein
MGVEQACNNVIRFCELENNYRFIIYVKKTDLNLNRTAISKADTSVFQLSHETDSYLFSSLCSSEYQIPPPSFQVR